MPKTMPMNPVVSFEKIFFAYQETYVLQDISFTIQEGEFIGIIGPNGGGKTTLLKLIMGFLKPTAGKIEIFGQPPCFSLNNLSYVPQAMHYDRQFPISVIELVLAGKLSKLPWYGIYSPADRRAAIEALERVGMVDYKNRAFGSLSGGQAQRVLIARALVSEPKLLLLDEPTASVDAQAEADIYGILKSLKGKMTILMVTHNLKMVIDQVERVLCVQGNCLTLNPQEVCEHFALGLYHSPLLNFGKTTSPEKME